MSVGALGANAQGLLNFTDYDTVITHIWSPQVATPTVQASGNSPATWAGAPASYTVNPDWTVGAGTIYTGVPLGGAAVNGGGANGKYQNGNNFTVQLEALGSGAAGYSASGVALSSLLPVSQYTVTSMNTGAANTYAGEFTSPNFSSSPDPGIPNAGGATPAADIALACWYNAGGDTTLAQAQTDPNGIWGESPEVAAFALAVPASLVAAGGTVALPPDQDTVSFSLQINNAVPEPSTVALGVMGVTAFLARRKKS